MYAYFLLPLEPLLVELFEVELDDLDTLLDREGVETLLEDLDGDEKDLELEDRLGDENVLLPDDLETETGLLFEREGEV